MSHASAVHWVLQHSYYEFAHQTRLIIAVRDRQAERQTDVQRAAGCNNNNNNNNSRLPIGGLLCGLGGPGSICYSGDGGIQQNCQVCWTHVWLPFPADCCGVSWPCQWVSYSLLHGAWKENSLTDRRRAWDCFSVSAFVNLSVALQLHVTPQFFCPWWLPGLSVTPYIFNF